MNRFLKLSGNFMRETRDRILSFARPSSLATRRSHFLYLLCSVGFICLLPSLLHAEHTRRWLETSYDEFLKGTAHGVAVRSDGRLELAP
ncbi:MAG: hypothetical protein WA299_18585, partial [Candidatus Acidiferrum sp.]